MIVITDLLRIPFDEGAKKTAINLINKMSLNERFIALSIKGDVHKDVVTEIVDTNKSFLNFKFLITVRSKPQNNIIYIPESSATIFSFIRALLLNIFTKKHVTILALQPRKYYGFKKIIFKMLAPMQILTPSKSYANYLHVNNIKSHSIPLGVDDEKYRQYGKTTCNDIRHKYNIPINKTVLLHVGHIRSSRNLEWLLDVKKKLPYLEVVIVGSSYNSSCHELKSRLVDNDIKIISQYIENMAELYNIADYYFFPVVDDQGAISTPLSVLEAMACNIPVFTTKFGSLGEMFVQDECLRFVSGSDEVVSYLKESNVRMSDCTNREKISNYTWKMIAKKIEHIVGDAV